jgi:predicted DNA-binding transcriptional regulator AlpA
MARRPTPASPQQGRARCPSTSSTDPYAANIAGLADNTLSVSTAVERLLTSKETADLLRVSESWLAKSRMRGDGPPFTKTGRSVSYLPSTVVRWLKSRQRSSTSE